MNRVSNIVGEDIRCICTLSILLVDSVMMFPNTVPLDPRMSIFLCDSDNILHFPGFVYIFTSNKIFVMTSFGFNKGRPFIFYLSRESLYLHGGETLSLWNDRYSRNGSMNWGGRESKWIWSVPTILLVFLFMYIMWVLSRVV